MITCHSVNKEYHKYPILIHGNYQKRTQKLFLMLVISIAYVFIEKCKRKTIQMWTYFKKIFLKFIC